MTVTHPTTKTSTPKHLWVVGILSLLWNAMGAMDYMMTELKVEAYMSQFTPEQLEFFYGFPTWVVATWALAVWGGVIGSLLLLFKKRWAVPAFLISLIAMVITALRNYVFSNGLEVAGDAFTVIFTAVIFVVSVLLYLYARAMQKRGVLR